MDADKIVTVIADSVAAVGAIMASIVALVQLPKITRQLKLGSVSVVLEIEAQMTSRKQRVADFDERIRLLPQTVVDEEERKRTARILSDVRKTAVEDWLNALDRLCFCIIKGYIDEIEWRKEYEDYLTSVVSKYKESFQADTPYTHIADLHQHWKRNLTKLKG